MGPEAKLYKKFKKATPTISYSRIENLAVPGVPDVLGYTKYNQFFTIEFKVAKANKVRLSPHQIAWHMRHPYKSFICIQALGPGTVRLYEGEQVRELAACGLKLEALCVGLEACRLKLQKLGA